MECNEPSRSDPGIEAVAFLVFMRKCSLTFSSSGASKSPWHVGGENVLGLQNRQVNADPLQTYTNLEAQRPWSGPTPRMLMVSVSCSPGCKKVA